jgi:hypothetical protein
VLNWRVWSWRRAAPLLSAQAGTAKVVLCCLQAPAESAGLDAGQCQEHDGTTEQQDVGRSRLFDATATMPSTTEATGIAHRTRVAVRDAPAPGLAANAIPARMSVTTSNIAAPARSSMTACEADPGNGTPAFPCVPGCDAAAWACAADGAPSL